jgi:hypothetical protein
MTSRETILAELDDDSATINALRGLINMRVAALDRGLSDDEQFQQALNLCAILSATYLGFLPPEKRRDAQRVWTNTIVHTANFVWHDVQNTKKGAIQ